MISDGQIQGSMHTVTMAPIGQISDGQIQQSTVAPVGQIPDGQIQATTVTFAPVTVISDGQPQAPTVVPISTIGDGQPEAPTSTVALVSTIPDGQPQATGASIAMVGCATNSSLSITLSGGVLKDSIGRTGYIASNFQFQFDDPPQAGALYTAGWSLCSNGSLALGGSNVFYQCLSGSFYNLYNEAIGGQCSPITLNALQLVQCA
jgi:hypothetical protein